MPNKIGFHIVGSVNVSDRDELQGLAFRLAEILSRSEINDSHLLVNVAVSDYPALDGWVGTTKMAVQVHLIVGIHIVEKTNLLFFIFSDTPGIITRRMDSLLGINASDIHSGIISEAIADISEEIKLEGIYGGDLWETKQRTIQEALAGLNSNRYTIFEF